MASQRELTLLEAMKRFSTEESAREFLENLRWPNGPVCPHCDNGDQNRIYSIAENAESKVRAGLYKCGDCREQFTVTVGTVFESSHIPLNKWLIAFYMMCASKTQVSALQLQRQLEIGSYRTAWFMCHRIRFALSEDTDGELLDGTVEADETWIGGVAHRHGDKGILENKTPVVSLVERDGRVRSQVVSKVNGTEITKILKEHVASTARLNTDDSGVYAEASTLFVSHDRVNHSIKEYARHDATIGRLATTNAVEGFFGNSKRSIDGTHHNISRKHLPLYFAELDYKYNTRKTTDGQRTIEGLRSIEGKRLTLKARKSST